jgi:hypothetical protein
MQVFLLYKSEKAATVGQGLDSFLQATTNVSTINGHLSRQSNTSEYTQHYKCAFLIRQHRAFSESITVGLLSADACAGEAVPHYIVPFPFLKTPSTMKSTVLGRTWAGKTDCVRCSPAVFAGCARGAHRHMLPQSLLCILHAPCLPLLVRVQSKHTWA